MNERSQLIQALSRLVDKFPEERVGQLIVNVATLSRPPTPVRTTEATDHELYEAAIQRESFAEPQQHARLSPLRHEVIRLAGERWPQAASFGRWISDVAKQTGSTLIHVSDEDLQGALLSNPEKRASRNDSLP